jgi:hypothetical protein
MTQNEYKNSGWRETFNTHTHHKKKSVQTQRFSSMTDQLKPSLLTLPVEFIYRIFNYLDDFHIFCTMRNICTHMNTIIDNYRRYKVSFYIKLLHVEFHLDPHHTSIMQPKNRSTWIHLSC